MDDLNDQYEQLLQSKMSIFVTYSELVEKNPYRVLSSYSYDFEERPLRSNRIASNPPVLEPASEPTSDAETVFDGSTVLLPSTLRNISEVPEHDEFIQLLINAKAMATSNSCVESVTWRGYVTDIAPDFKMTRVSLRKELLRALQHLTILSEMERKVKSCNFKLFDRVCRYFIIIHSHSFNLARHIKFSIAYVKLYFFSFWNGSFPT